MTRADLKPFGIHYLRRVVGPHGRVSHYVGGIDVGGNVWTACRLEWHLSADIGAVDADAPWPPRCKRCAQRLRRWL